MKKTNEELDKPNGRWPTNTFLQRRLKVLRWQAMLDDKHPIDKEILKARYEKEGEKPE